MPRIVLIASAVTGRPPQRAEVVDDPSVPPHLAKVIYLNSRTGARVARHRIIEEEAMPPRKRATPPPNYAGDDRPPIVLDVDLGAPGMATPAKAVPAKRAKAAPARGATKSTRPGKRAGSPRGRAVETVDVDLAAVGVQLLHVDPAELVVGANVRSIPQVDDAFVASLREHGVIEPITAYRDDVGDLVVVHGQRRTLGAVRARLATVPVLVQARPADPDRIAKQLTENDQRAALAVSERVAAYEQLAALGVKPAQIAKRTSSRVEDVEAGLRIARSPAALSAVSQAPELTIPQLAVIAEFDDDEDAVQDLLEVARDGGHGFDHVAQQYRDERAEKRRRRELEPQLIPAGVVVCDPDVMRGEQVAELDDLRHDGEPLTPETHRECPGHAAYVTWTDEDDWPEIDDDGNALLPQDGSVVVEPRPGLAPGEDGRRVWYASYICTAFRDHGHTLSYGGGVYATPAGTGGQVADGSVSPDAAAERRRREQEQARQRERERAKAWEASTTVRRDWIRQHLQAKSLPKGAGRFIAHGLCRSSLFYSSAAFTEMAEKLLGAKGDDLVAVIGRSSEARALVLTYGLVLAAHERSWYMSAPWAADYLRYLEEQGYDLSDVEREVVDGGGAQ